MQLRRVESEEPDRRAVDPKRVAVDDARAAGDAFLLSGGQVGGSRDEGREHTDRADQIGSRKAGGARQRRKTNHAEMINQSPTCFAEPGATSVAGAVALRNERVDGADDGARPWRGVERPGTAAQARARRPQRPREADLLDRARARLRLRAAAALRAVADQRFRTAFHPGACRRGYRDDLDPAPEYDRLARSGRDRNGADAA